MRRAVRRMLPLAAAFLIWMPTAAAQAADPTAGVTMQKAPGKIHVSIDGKYAGITPMPHPDNFRPCWWHARDYGLVTANPFGRAAFCAGPPSKVVVSPGTSVHFRFGILLHVGVPT